MIVVEHIVGETANFREVRVPLHQIGLYVELETLLGPLSLVESSKDEDVLGVDRHTHGEVTSCPGGLGIQVDHAPHVVIDVVHLDGVRDFFLIEFCTAREDIDVFVVEDTGSSAVTSNIEISNPAPCIILDIIFLTSCVEALGIVTTNDEDETSLRVESSEVRPPEEQRALIDQLLLVVVVLKHPVAADVVLVTATDAKYFTFISNQSAAEFRNDKVVKQNHFFGGVLVYIVEVDVLGAPLEVMDELPGAVALLQDESIVEELRELTEDVNVRVVGDSARELSHFSLLSNQLLGDGIEAAPDSLEAVKVEL